MNKHTLFFSDFKYTFFGTCFPFLSIIRMKKTAIKRTGLTNQQKLDIQKSSLSTTHLASKYNCSARTIQKIRSSLKQDPGHDPNAKKNRKPNYLEINEILLVRPCKTMWNCNFRANFKVSSPRY